jgi:hypothetical protein
LASGKKGLIASTEEQILKNHRLSDASLVLSALIGLMSLPAAAQTTVLTPQIGRPVTVTPVTINNSSGDQTDPHVDGDLASYTDSATSAIRYYRFSTGVDAAIPSGAAIVDVLSGVSGNLIAFSRIETDRNAIVVFDTAANTTTEIAPQAGSYRIGSAIGGNTVAFIDMNVNMGELDSYDLAANTLQPITSDLAVNQNPNVAPDGNTIVWESCPTTIINCDIKKAIRPGSGSSFVPSTVANSPDPEGNPDTDGTTIVYDGNLTGSPTGQDIYFVPVAGGPTTQLAIAGYQQNPSIRAGIIAFESRTAPGSNSDLFLYVIATNTLYQVTNTPGVNEMLTNLSVLPDGEIRMVWAADDGPDGEQNIYGATFSLPPHCPSLELGASVTWNPGHCLGKNFCTNGFFSFQPELIKPDPPIEFPLPTKLPVAQGNAASGIAALLFSYKSMLSVCYYQGANGGIEYDLVTCDPSKAPGSAAGESADTIGLAVASAQPSGVTQVKVSLPILNCTP